MQITLEELKANVDKYIAMAEQQEIIITKDGEQTAKIVSSKFDRVAAFKSILEEMSSGEVSDLASQLHIDETASPALGFAANLIGAHAGKEQGHADRMQSYLEVIIKALLEDDHYKKEVASWDTPFFLLSARLHDIGETAVPESFFKKVGDLSDAEYKEIKAHTDFGMEIVRQVKENLELDTLFHHAEVLAGSHHEKWDGTGYPLGLKADDIPLQGRIMALVDVYDALTTTRPHREKKTHKEAVEIIRNSSGTHFDPGVVEAFLKYEDEFSKLGD